MKINTKSTLSYSKTGNKTRATCFATLLQNESYSDVACFTTHVQTCLATTIKCCKVFFFRGWVIHATSLFNSFCNHVAKQIARLLMAFYPSLNSFNDIVHCYIFRRLCKQVLWIPLKCVWFISNEGENSNMWHGLTGFQCCPILALY